MPSLTIHNPATGEPLCTLPADDEHSVAAKAAAARVALPAWSAVPLPHRLAMLQRFRATVVAERDTLATTLTREVGKPITQSRGEIDGLLPRLDFFLDHTQRTIADEQVFDAGGMRECISHAPLGVVANISAWNYPWFVGCNVIVPALLTGNVVLYKPSEHATLSGLHLTRLLHAAGVPREVMQCLVGAGEVGAALLRQPLDGVFFTGSHATGLHVARNAPPLLARLQLELGGKDPAYVRADADMRSAAASLADGAMYNTGQSCCAVERIYVHHGVHDAFVEHFVAAVKALRGGDPMDARTTVGAITRKAQLQVLLAQVDDALANGARLHCGGRAGAGPGHWFAPTVFTEVNHSMALMRDESFGPIIGIQRVADDDEALALMNDTRYGLTAAVYTRDEAKARELLARVNAGTVYWNCCDRVSPRLPWSGRGDSGVGLTLSTHGILAFTRPKAWHLRSH